VPRLLTGFFATLLLASVFFVTVRIAGPFAGAAATAFLMASPAFLELASSCMLEIPALAPAFAGMALLLLPKTRWFGREVGSGILLAIALLTKLVVAVLLPVIFLIVVLRPNDFCDGSLRRSGRVPASIRAFSASVPSLVVIGFSMIISLVMIEYAIDGGAFFRNFQQTWSSHFAAAKSSEYGSANDHPFDWLVFARNWDLSVIGIVGAAIAMRNARRQPLMVTPVFWLVWEILVFSIHRPWWPYYYVHIAPPLCWCAGIGVAAAWKQFRTNKRIGPRIFIGVYAMAALCWMCGRVYLEISDIRKLPRLSSSLVLQEIQRFKPHAKFMFCDDIIYSFHAGIPMPPNLAVVPLKRLWAGDMTNERIGQEMRAVKPELLLLNTDTSERPFTDLIIAEYQLVFEDGRYRLYARQDIARLAQY
jgi:hypothetical protein